MLLLLLLCSLCVAVWQRRCCWGVDASLSLLVLTAALLCAVVTRGPSCVALGRAYSWQVGEPGCQGSARTLRSCQRPMATMHRVV